MRHPLAWMSVVVLLLSGCASSEDDGIPAEERYGGPDAISFTEADEDIPYREGQPQIEDSPEVTDIQNLLDIRDPGTPDNPSPAWYAFASDYPYPQGSVSQLDVPCDALFGNKVYELENELPVTIRGAVTLEKHYEKPSICGEDHRFYGVYALQDDTGTIMVLKDSRISDFTYGDRVQIRVLGIMKSFGRMMVIADEAETVLDSDAPVPYRRLNEGLAPFMLGEDVYNALNPSSPQVQVPSCWTVKEDYSHEAGFGVLENYLNTYRVEGTVVGEPTSTNFNQMTLERMVNGEPQRWVVSFGLELGRRGVGVELGDRVRVTAPAGGRTITLGQCSWNFRMYASSIGQIEILSGDGN